MGHSCVNIIQNLLVDSPCTLLVHVTLGRLHGPHHLSGQEAPQLVVISAPPTLWTGPGVTGLSPSHGIIKYLPLLVSDRR